MALKLPSRDPDEVLDYVVDWSARLSADTISTSSFAIDSGVAVIGVTSATTTTTTVWLSGGVAGEITQVRARIVTAGGRTMDQTLTQKINNR